jgi:hypothetical protein
MSRRTERKGKGKERSDGKVEGEGGSKERCVEKKGGRTFNISSTLRKKRVPFLFHKTPGADERCRWVDGDDVDAVDESGDEREIC